MRPASTIIEALGGEAVVAEITGLRITTPYRWQYPRDKGGTGGIIPRKHLVKLLAYARRNNIQLAAESFLAPEVTDFLSTSSEHRAS